MSSIYKCATLALAQAAYAATQDHSSTFAGAAPNSKQTLQSSYYAYGGDYYYSDSYSYYYYHEETVGEKIKDELEDVFNGFVDRYIDEEAYEQWLEDTETSFNEMNERHQAEGEEFWTGVAEDVVAGAQDVAKQVSADATDALEQAKADLKEKIEQAVTDAQDQIDDVTTEITTDEVVSPVVLQYNYEEIYPEYEYEETLADKIRNTLEDASEEFVDRYIDEEAFESWAESRAQALQELSDAHQAEAKEELNKIRSDVESGVEDVASQVKSDLSDALDQAKSDLKEKIEEAATQAQDQIDEAMEGDDTAPTPVVLQEYYYNDDYYYDYEEYEQTAGEKILDELEDVYYEFVDRYIDEEALESWSQNKTDVLKDMQARHQDEGEEFWTGVAEDVMAGAQDVASLVAEDVKDALEQAQADMSEQIDEAVSDMQDQIDESTTFSDDESAVILATVATEQAGSSFQAQGTAALSLGAAATLAYFYFKKNKLEEEDLDQGFDRI